MSITTKINAAVIALAKNCLAEKHMVCTAESCTGGGIAANITALAGSSAWFERSFVTYCNRAKEEMLGVNPHTLLKLGAVSQAVVEEMVSGALTYSAADLAIAVTGIAGPDGGSADKPVGTVWFAWQRRGGKPYSLSQHFLGDRTDIRQQAILFALRQACRQN